MSLTRAQKLDLICFIYDKVTSNNWVAFNRRFFVNSCSTGTRSYAVALIDRNRTYDFDDIETYRTMSGYCGAWKSTILNRINEDFGRVTSVTVHHTDIHEHNTTNNYVSVTATAPLSEMGKDVKQELKKIEDKVKFSPVFLGQLNDVLIQMENDEDRLKFLLGFTSQLKELMEEFVSDVLEYKENQEKARQEAQKELERQAKAEAKRRKKLRKQKAKEKQSQEEIDAELEELERQEKLARIRKLRARAAKRDSPKKKGKKSKKVKDSKDVRNQMVNEDSSSESLNSESSEESSSEFDEQ